MSARSTESTAIQDRSVVDLEKAKAYLKLDEDDTTEDVILELLISAAKQKADTYCCNLFTTSSGTEKPIPSDVEVWLLQTVASFYFHRIKGLAREKVEETAEQELFPHSVDINYFLLKPYRLEPGFGGKR